MLARLLTQRLAAKHGPIRLGVHRVLYFQFEGWPGVQRLGQVLQRLFPLHRRPTSYALDCFHPGAASGRRSADKPDFDAMASPGEK